MIKMSSVLDGPYTPAKINLVKGSVYEGCTHAAFDAYRDRGRPTLNCTEMHRIDFSLPSCVAIFLWRRVPFGFHPSSLCCRCNVVNRTRFGSAKMLFCSWSTRPRTHGAYHLPGGWIFRRRRQSFKEENVSVPPFLPLWPALRTSSSHDRISSRRAVGNDHQAIKGSMEARRRRRRRRRPEGRAEAGGGAEAAEAAEGGRLAII